MESDFSKYLFRKFLEYQGTKGRIATQTEFAEWIGVSQSLMTQWLNGKWKPSPAKAILLADKLGDEVFDYLDEEPDMDLVYVNQAWEKLDDTGRQFIRECAEKYLVTMETGETYDDQLLELMRQWAAERGYTIQETPISKGGTPDQQPRS